jgi:hypothetical protein
MPESNSKLCRKCGVVKPFSDFHKSQKSPSGLQSLCKPCKADAQRRYRGTPPKDPCIPTSVPAGQNYCSRCKCIKPASDFGKSPSGLRTWCKPCCRDYRLSWTAATACTVTLTEKKCGRCGQVKSADNFTSDKKRRDGLCPFCKPCWQADTRKRNSENLAVVQEKRRKYQAENKDKRAAYKKANADKIRAQNKAYRAENQAKYQKWREENAERMSTYAAEYRKANRDRLIAVDKEWRKVNQGLVRRNEIARLYNKLQATPSWSNLDAISAVYIEAKRLEELDGVKRHVDHIVPIKHKLVCGLHVPANLQILTAFENQSKGNRFKIQ